MRPPALGLNAVGFNVLPVSVSVIILISSRLGPETSLGGNSFGASLLPPTASKPFNLPRVASTKRCAACRSAKHEDAVITGAVSAKPMPCTPRWSATAAVGGAKPHGQRPLAE